jgi:hypothetical protein
MSAFNGSVPDDVFGTDLQGAFSSFSLTSDFYCESDDVTRGVTLDACALDFHRSDDFQSPHLEFGFDVPPLLCLGDAGLKAKDFHLESAVVQKMPAKALGSHIPRPAFFEGDEAPLPPDDAFFEFALTTMTVHGMSGAQIANAIVDFLDKEVRRSCINKVSRKKLTIKAEVCLETSHCEMKARVYRQALGGYSVELQRRCGDVIAFNHLWQGLSRHLNLCMTGVGGAYGAHSTQPLIEPIIPDVPCEDVVAQDVESSSGSLQPLLSLAECSDPRLQAEAILALAHAAQNMKVAAQLCTPQVLLLLQRMSEAVCFNILEPLWRLVCLLSVLPEARGLPEMQHLQESLKVVGFAENSCALVH